MIARNAGRISPDFTKAAGETTAVGNPHWPLAPAGRAFWRRSWPLPVSLLFHGLLLAGGLLQMTPNASPPPIPQIELLPPAPLPALPEEAMPSPADTPVKQAVAQAQASRPIPTPPADAPLSTTSPKAETSIPKPPKKIAPPPKQKAPPTPDLVKEPDNLKPTASESSALPVSGQQTDKQTIQMQPAATNHAAGPPADYIGLIRAKLEKAKRYPLQARRSGQEGVVSLRFALDRSGRLLSWKIEKGSGAESLDDAVDDMIQRAAPFPPFPSSVDRDRMDLVVPIEFSLNMP